MNARTSVLAGALVVGSVVLLGLGLGATSSGAVKSPGELAEVRLPAKAGPDQRTALDLEVAFGKNARGTAVVVRHQPSGEVIGTVTPYGIGADGGVGRFALTLPQDLEQRLRRENKPLRLELETRDGADEAVVLRSVAPKLVPTAR